MNIKFPCPVYFVNLTNDNIKRIKFWDLVYFNTGKIT